MSTMVQQIQELPEAIKPVAAPSASYGERPTQDHPVTAPCQDHSDRPSGPLQHPAQAMVSRLP